MATTITALPTVTGTAASAAATTLAAPATPENDYGTSTYSCNVYCGVGIGVGVSVGILILLILWCAFWLTRSDPDSHSRYNKSSAADADLFRPVKPGRRLTLKKRQPPPLQQRQPVEGWYGARESIHAMYYDPESQLPPMAKTNRSSLASEATLFDRSAPAPFIKKADSSDSAGTLRSTPEESDKILEAPQPAVYYDSPRRPNAAREKSHGYY